MDDWDEVLDNEIYKNNRHADYNKLLAKRAEKTRAYQRQYQEQNKEKKRKYDRMYNCMQRK